MGRIAKKCVTIFTLPKMLQGSLLHPITVDLTDKTHLALWKQAMRHCKSSSQVHILTKACGSQGLVLTVQHFLIPFESTTLLSSPEENISHDGVKKEQTCEWNPVLDFFYLIYRFTASIIQISKQEKKKDFFALSVSCSDFALFLQNVAFREDLHPPLPNSSHPPKSSQTNQSSLSSSL